MDAGQFGTRTPKGDITITTRVQGVTVGASSFFQGTAILHVLSNAIRVLEPGTLHKPPSLSIHTESQYLSRDRLHGAADH